jgi:glyoxylase-like metal-dependent hydrolase (beta-lactamase superfamily II)/predicted ester cyclase
MASASEIAKRYFKALNDHDLDGAAACWAPGAVDRLVGQLDVVGPGGVREYFGALFAAFPDFSLEVLDTTTARNRTAVRWQARGTFAGPGRFQGFEPNGAQIEIEGCDVLTIGEDLIQHNDAYLDAGDVARQLGFLPAAGSPAEARLAKLANARTKLTGWIHGAQPERIAEGVWIVRGGFPSKTMNVYLIEDEGGVTVFDAGIEAMTAAVRSAAARLGGIKRVVLGHADADHRGAAPGLGAPVFCHPSELDAARSSDPFRPYWRLDKLDRHGRLLLPRLLPTWDGGAVQIAGTVSEGDAVAGFKVIELPGHAPGLIGLFREHDRLALVSDCVYTLDAQTGIKGRARVPHHAFNLSTQQAADSIRKLASLEPSAAWPGHTEPVRGDVVAQLHQAAATVPV